MFLFFIFIYSSSLFLFVATNRTSEQVSGERKQAQSELKKLQEELNSLKQEQQEKKNKILSVNNEIYSLKSSITTKQSKLETSRKVLEQHELIVNEIKSVQEEIQRLQQQQQPLDAKLQAAVSQRERFKDHFRELENKVRNEMQQIQKEQEQLKTLNREVSKLAAKEAELETSVKLRAEISSRIHEKEKEIEALKRDSLQCTNQLDKEQSVKRNLVDNISLRKKIAQVAKHEKEMKAIDEELAKLNVGDINDEKQSIRGQQQKLQSEVCLKFETNVCFYISLIENFLHLFIFIFT